jgi:hypothetical protein
VTTSQRFGFHDRNDAVDDLRQVGLLRLVEPEVQFRFGKDVAGIGESWHPAAVFQPGVPADVIDVKMRAQNEMDVVDGQPGGGQASHERVVLLLMPQRARRTVLVVADAAIDQDVVLAGLHDI